MSIKNNMKQFFKGLSTHADSLAKIITALVAAGGFIWGIIQFQTEQKHLEDHEFQLKLWEKKLEVYNQLSDVTGHIIIHRNDGTKLDSLQNQFDLLYYASMVIVEDEDVEVKMIAFREALTDFRQEIKGESYLKKKLVQLMREVGKSRLTTQEKLLNDE